MSSLLRFVGSVVIGVSCSAAIDGLTFTMETREDLLLRFQLTDQLNSFSVDDVERNVRPLSLP